MVPDKFNMVDMEGIDLIESQGVEVPGLYQKLVESIAQCRYQCLYNWKFDGILIPPTYVEMVATDEEVTINGGVSVDLDDVIHIYSLANPVIEPLSVTANGTYTPQEGVDGFSPVEVEVEVNPVIKPLEVLANGVYTAPDGVDGYSPVEVSVTSESPFLTPDYQGFSHSFISGTGQFINDNQGKRYFINCFHLAANKNYAIFIGLVTETRDRCAFFGGKSISDFTQYIENGVSTQVVIYEPTTALSSGDPPVTTRYVITPSVDGELILFTSRTSVQAIGYCV